MSAGGRIRRLPLTLATGNVALGVIAGLILLAGQFAPSAMGADLGSTAGLSLFRISGARASAMGEAFTAMKDDITAFEFNPGSLARRSRNRGFLGSPLLT